MTEEYTTIADFILRALKKVNVVRDLLAATSHHLMLRRYHVSAGLALAKLDQVVGLIRRPIDTALGRCQPDSPPPAIRVALRVVRAGTLGSWRGGQWRYRGDGKSRG